MSLLNTVQSGKKLLPLAILFHAPHGIGKSTFATEAPSPIYIGNEENDELDVARFPKVSTWKDLTDQLKTLLSEKHDYKTVVIDTIDGLEQIAQKEILQGKEAGKTMATAMGGFGKAYEKMYTMFLDLRDNYIVPLRSKGMNIVLLAHSQKVKFEEVMTLTSYDHYETAMHKKIKPVFEDWVSAILFANYNLVRAETTSGKEYAESCEGERIIFTEELPSCVAKNRFNLPREIKFEKSGTWDNVKNLVLQYYKKEKEVLKVESVAFDSESLDLQKQIDELLLKMPEDIKAGITSSLKRANFNPAELKRIIKKMQGILA